MQFHALLVNKDDGIAIVSLNRPEALNAINGEIIAGLKETAVYLEEAKDVGVVIITGEGRAFCAGADIKGIRESTPVELRSGARAIVAAIESFGGISKPVIAAVNGLALGGGCELALGCDFIIASDKARFGVPEIKIGTLPAAGGMARLARAVGIRKAKEMVLTGEPIDAQTALEIGLANRVFPADTLMEEVKKIARAILNQPPITVRLGKEALNDTQDSPMAAAIARDIETTALTFTTADQKEGMAAFVEKRKPKFEGR